MTIRTVRAVPYTTMKQFLNDMDCMPSLEAEEHEKTYIVSITNPDMMPLVRKNTETSIGLQFDDDGISFTKKMAIEICQLVKKAMDDPADVYFLVNCQAGISRSGAVSAFVQQLCVNYDDWVRKNRMVCPNYFVLSALLSVWEELYGAPSPVR